MTRRIILADVETTGIGTSDAICEIAYHEITEDFETVSQACNLINPGIPISPGASGVNGITDAMVADAPGIGEFMVKAGFPLMGSDVVLTAHNCVTGDHQVRTRDGWVRLDQLEDGVDVIQWDHETAQLTFVTPVVVRKHYSGEMLQWDSQYHKGVYTPEHRMYFKAYQGAEHSWRIGTAAEVAERGPNTIVVPCSGFLESDTPIELTPAEVRVMEMIRADGSIQKTKKAQRYSIRFKFKKQRKVERCMSLLEELQISYSYRIDKHGVTNIRIYSEEVSERLASLLMRNGKKGYGAWVLSLSRTARLALLDELQYWDGSKRAGGMAQTTVHSSNPDDVVWLSELAVFTGSCASTKFDIPNTRGFSRSDGVIHRVCIRPRSQVKTLYSPQVINHNGQVYCLTVPTGAFLVRRDGATWVTGNCNFDRRFLAPFMSEDAEQIDTLRCARILYPDADNHKQSTLAYYLGLKIDRSKAHSADGDLDVLLQLLKRICQDAGVGILDLITFQKQPINVRTIGFGKHRGTKLADLDTGYVRWLLTKCDNLDPDLRASLEKL